jgi:hypothetical protein
LRNAQSWLAGGRASLEVEVCSDKGQPIGGIEIAAFVEGVAELPEKKLAVTDCGGRASLEFPLPEIANPEGAALVILARNEQGLSQLRYRIKAVPSPGKS